MQQGHINIGVLKNDLLVPLPWLLSDSTNGDEKKDTAAIEGQKNEEEQPHAPPPEATEDAIQEQLYKILLGVDLESTSEKMLRSQLADFFGIDMKPHKGFIRELVTEYLEHNGPPPRYAERKRAEREAKERQEKEAKKKKYSKGRVVVVGAGPAGLSAALQLKVLSCLCFLFC